MEWDGIGSDGAIFRRFIAHHFNPGCCGFCALDSLELSCCRLVKKDFSGADLHREP
jgi:hypothetical protein